MTKKSKRVSKRKRELPDAELSSRSASAGGAHLSTSPVDSQVDSQHADVLKEYERIIDTEQRRVRAFSDTHELDVACSPPHSPPPPSTIQRHAAVTQNPPELSPRSQETLSQRGSVASLAEPMLPAALTTPSGPHVLEQGKEVARGPRQPAGAEDGGRPMASPVLSDADSHLLDLEHVQSDTGHLQREAPRPSADRTQRQCSCSRQEEVGRERPVQRSDSNSSMGKAGKPSCRHCKYLQACLDRERLNANQHRLKIERNNSSMITLNVGGNVFTTSVNTLVSDSSSMLSAMFSGKYAPAKDELGRYFIDRDGTHFRFVLNFLRDGTVRLPDDLQSLQELMQEAQYYQIPGLIAAIAEAPRLSKNEYITIRYLPANTYDGWPIRIEGPLEPHIICDLHGGVLPPDRETADVRNMYGQSSTGWKVRGMFLTKIFNIIASYGWQLTTSNGSGGGKQRNFAEMYVFSRSKLMRRKRLQRKRRSASYTYTHLFAMPASYSQQPRPAAHGVPRPPQPPIAFAEGYFSPEEDETVSYHVHPPRSTPAAEPAIPVPSEEEPLAILLPGNVSGGAGVPVPAEQYAPSQMNA